ncbi:ribonuclease H2 subunit B [Phoenix dactylifera]|uniref:Ribonuclease H2 subunit B n=1 Tax=Phoenix dactylifera TaxID=42345 RepID=A0A8B9ASP4_PHODC|nr:ribonuclease H2 subunit B [Phoenix dactylifera]
MAWFDGLEEPRLLISPQKDTTTNVNAEGCILSLCHPKSGKPTNYVFSAGKLQELHWFKQSCGSWFLGDYVCEDGSLYIATPIDPIFILLPVFEAARMTKGNDQGMFRQLDEILYVDGYPGYQHLMSVAEDSMQLVSEVKEIGSAKFFRLNDSQVLAWLCHKVQRLKATLPKLDKNYAAQEKMLHLVDIVSILGEYVKDEPWLTCLCSHLQTFSLDIQEMHTKVQKNETDSTFLDNTPVSSRPLQGKVGNGKSNLSNGRQSKKLKTPTDSQNIKDMFYRATRKGT